MTVWSNVELTNEYRIFSWPVGKRFYLLYNLPSVPGKIVRKANQLLCRRSLVMLAGASGSSLMTIENSDRMEKLPVQSFKSLQTFFKAHDQAL
ncbi:hypothetical protein T02_12383 [Trichinella nativa]|uniref:Uncharacterized protein n=1 Tax=Trichinella nativa TaxID=6335 RepID=A0A0V1LGJ5_9BILA|nr:hypothetical protein T02_12383 [Trichinella nativa]